MSTLKIVMNRVPLYWRNEASGKLPAAVMAYLSSTQTQEQLDLVIAYVRAWVECPVWKNIEPLRESVKGVKTHEELRKWIWEALDYGIDPL